MKDKEGAELGLFLLLAVFYRHLPLALHFKFIIHKRSMLIPCVIILVHIKLSSNLHSIQGGHYILIDMLLPVVFVEAFMREDLTLALDKRIIRCPPSAVMLITLVLALRLFMHLALAIEEVYKGEADEEVGRPVKCPKCKYVQELQDKGWNLLLMNLEVVHPVDKECTDRD